MLGVLSTELRGLLSSRGEDIVSIRPIRGMNDRVDALTLLCRDALRESSLCYIDGDVHFFNGRMYVPCGAGEVLSVLGNELVDLGASPSDVRRMGDMPMTVVLERRYPRPYLLTFANGVLDASGMVFYEEFSPKRISVESLSFGYDASAGCPVWDAFLREVLPDEAVRMCLQEFFGMVYMDRESLSVEKFALFVGRGANGKSVIFEVMKRVIGEGNVTTLDPAQLSDEKMLPYVGGKRLNFSPDLARSKDFGSSLKALASGQDVTGRRIYGDAEKVKCPPLCFALNEMPRMRDVTDAFFRRLLYFSFDVCIPPERQDKGLVGKICASDMPGIFNWMIAGRDKLVRHGGEFTFSEKMRDDLRALKDAVNPYAEYPVRAYLASRGLSLRPMYDGQMPVAVSQGEIISGLGGMVSKTAVTRELRGFGVDVIRGAELSYKVYQI